MTTQVHLIFAMTTLHNYIKDHIIEMIDYFEGEIDKETVLISISNIVSLGTSLAISTRMNRKRDVIINKMWVDYTAY